MPPALTSRRDWTTGAAIGVAATLAGYKLYAMGLDHPLLWVAGYAIDVAVIALAWLAAVVLEARIAPRRSRLAELGFWGVLTAWFIIDFAYTFFFDSASERHYSLLDVHWKDVGYFFGTLLPPAGWAWLACLAAVTVAVAGWVGQRVRRPAVRRAAVGVAGLVLVTAALVGTLRDIPHPVIDAIRDARERMARRVAVDPRARPAAAVRLFDTSGAPTASVRTRFSKVVVIVMETMPLDTYRKEVSALPRENFFRTLGRHAHSYEQYFTTNQDSRTAMLAMLGARWIPYEAYTDDDLARYGAISRLSNLPALFHDLGYETAYALSQVDEEAVVSDYPWQRIFSLTKARIAELKGKFLCFNPFEFEDGCEDKSILPEVVDFLATHDKAFLYQEMMWGHSDLYNQASGKGNAEYYAEYVEALWRELTRRGLADQTLLVLTSDHGDKAQDRLLVNEAYQVPLFFYATGFTPRHVSGMYTHLDFKDLLLRELDPRRPKVRPEPFVQIVGPTSTMLRVVIDSAGGFLGYKERDGVTYLDRASGAPAPDLSAHHRLFEDYRTYFDTTLQRALTAPAPTPAPGHKPAVLPPAKGPFPR